MSDLTMSQAIIPPVTPSEHIVLRDKSNKQATLTTTEWIKKKKRAEKYFDLSDDDFIPSKKKPKTVKNKNRKPYTTKTTCTTSLKRSEYNDFKVSPKVESSPVTLTQIKDTCPTNEDKMGCLLRSYAYTSNKSTNPTFVGSDLYAEPGDIVYCTAGRVKHPAVKEGLLNKEYIMIGAVGGYVYPDENFRLRDERCIVDWLKVKVKLSQQIDVTIEEKVEIPPVFANLLSIVSKNNKDKIDGFNPWFTKEINDNYYFKNEFGWKKK